MANLQAIGFDGETIIYLLADGTGTDLDPFVSKFALTDGTITAIENILPEFVFDGTRLTVKTELNQPLTLAELQGLTVKTEEQTPLDLTAIEAKLAELTVVANKLQVDANVVLPDTYNVTGTVSVDNFPATQLVTGDFYPIVQDVDTGLDQPLTDTQLRANPIQTEIVNNVSVIGDFALDKSGLATDTNQTTTNTTLSTINGKIPSNLTVASTRLLVDGSGVTQPISGNLTNISGTISLPTGAATATNQTTSNNLLASLDGKLPVLESGRVSVVLPSSQIATLTPPTTVTANLGTIAGAATATNQATIIGHIDNIESALAGTIRNNPINAGTPTLTNVASSASSVTLITENNNRKTLIIVNDSTATLYLKFDASTASTSSYSHILPPITNGIPSVLSLNGSDYSGEIRGIWSSANGFARITEVV